MFCYDGVCIRVVEESDIETIRRMRNDYSTWVNLTDGALIDSENQRQWYGHIMGRDDKKYFVIYNDENTFIGIVRFDEIDQTNRSIRVGCDILKELRGKGFGNKTMNLIKKYCFRYLNVHRIWLAVLATNNIALHLYKKHGFREEGKYREAIFRDGKYHDYIIMSIIEGEYPR